MFFCIVLLEYLRRNIIISHSHQLRYEQYVNTGIYNKPGQRYCFVSLICQLYHINRFLYHHTPGKFNLNQNLTDCSKMYYHKSVVILPFTGHACAALGNIVRQKLADKSMAITSIAFRLLPVRLLCLRIYTDLSLSGIHRTNCISE